MKGLLALVLMVALLAIGNTDAAGPLGVSMGEPIKPDKGWDSRGYGTEEREYKGSLRFRGMHIEGTRKGGACGIVAYLRPPVSKSFPNFRDRLEGKHGRPYRVRVFDHDRKAEWRFAENPDKVAKIILSYKTLEYRFENYHECEEDPEKAKAMMEAAENAKAKREAALKAEREKQAARLEYKKAVERSKAREAARLKAKREKEAAERAKRQAAEKARREKEAAEKARRAACPFRICMGDRISAIWDAGGWGEQTRTYSGSLPFEKYWIQGTRKGGACSFYANGWFDSKEDALDEYDKVLTLLIDKYGKPDKQDAKTLFFGQPSDNPEARWYRFNPNPNNIHEMALWVKRIRTDHLPNNQVLGLSYWFNNHDECKKAKKPESADL